MSDFEIKTIAAEFVLPLRQKLLRPGANLKKCVFEGDNDINSFHLGIYQDEKLRGIASFLKENHPHFPQKAFRLRGMAIETAFQGKGYGRKLFEHGIGILKSKQAELLWFNAREKAVGFYKKQGFRTLNEKFIISEVGPHYMMAGKL